MKAFRTLVSGEDDELARAYDHFHKMVDAQQSMLLSRSSVSIEQIKGQNATLHAFVERDISINERVEANTISLVDQTRDVRAILESTKASIRLSDLS